ncbi:MAG: L(+)-tartrate dehydratase subunit alpha [Solobacterium sp.]|nr:L(+)-tartrate dehydratase subunit alpha [Solobacterium sp.]
MDRTLAREIISERVERYLGMAATRLPDDVMTKLQEVGSKETNEMQQTIYDAYFMNLELAKKLHRPCCQDTGILHFYMTVGAEFPYIGVIEEALREAVHNATESVPLRPNSIDYFKERNTGDNTGERVPWLHWEIAPERDDLEIITYFAGGGCCLPGNSKVYKPSEGYGSIVKAVFDTVTGLGINACPPLIVGVGLGTNMENAAVLSKQAYLRPLGTHHPHPRAAELEDALRNGLNKVGIGAQGLNGNTVALEVHIESSARHTADVAVGVNVSCYMHRRGIIRFDRDLNCEVSGYADAEEYMKGTFRKEEQK